jgi:(2S)-methylsuccinyl-CoA dehydrogenase
MTLHRDELELCRAALQCCDELASASLASLRRTLGSPASAACLDEHQAAAHGYAWLATYVRALHEILDWAQRLQSRGRLRDIERLIVLGAFAEYLAQIAGGIPLSQVEYFRPRSLDEDAAARFAGAAPVRTLCRNGFDAAARARLAQLLVDGFATSDFGDPALDDDALRTVREQFRRYADAHAQDAHEWHLRDVLIPDEVIASLGELGVFGLTIEEQYGGAALGKVAMCVVTEELSRGYIGLGSLGTRSEIAAELIRAAGTPQQKARLLPGIAAGTLLPTAAFTEPDVGSDLAAVKTRAHRVGGVYRVRGAKTWMTHGARSDLMTLLVRTDAQERGHRGLSILLAEKPRGCDEQPFPAAGMNGSEIRVLGYRGMKEYEVSFDGFEVPASALLGGVEGEGFRQLMQTFETARIQTGARAVGVAQSALELALRYAVERHQFGCPLLAFPRVSDKLAWMGVETMVARQLTLHAARTKDEGGRCDIEAGMAKLLAARVAWSNADAAVQIHGGNGYAQEYRVSRVLCDARILSVFEGAAEIQAQVIVRRLLDSP